MAHPNHQLPDEYKMETLDKVPTEDKIIMSREEDYPVKELTPGEVSHLVTKAMRDLPHTMQYDDTLKDVFFELAYSVMTKMTE